MLLDFFYLLQMKRNDIFSQNLDFIEHKLFMNSQVGDIGLGKPLV